MIELIPFILFFAVCVLLMLGFPVAFTLAGTALAFASAGIMTGTFDASLLNATPNRLFGIINNQTLIAVPLFIFMGILLERSRIAEGLLTSMAQLFGHMRGGLAISVVLVGALLAASTGIVGATVVTMGLMSLPVMLEQKYKPEIATGTICATGTLGQIIPPSIALILLGDTLSSAYQKVQLQGGVLNPKTISVGDLFMGALIPGLILVLAYVLYIFIRAQLKPEEMPAMQTQKSISWFDLLGDLFAPLLLILLVLGSILLGIATPTEAAALGALGALCLAKFKTKLSLQQLRDVLQDTLKLNAMIFMILIGATIFSLVFRGFNGDEIIHQFFNGLPGEKFTALFVIMLIIFLLGFILDFIEIIFVVVPIVAPILLAMGFDPLWLGILIAINLQTSFLTPPFGFALFYLRGVAPASIETTAMYRGVIPFIFIQLLVLLLIVCMPKITTWLPYLLKAS